MIHLQRGTPNWTNAVTTMATNSLTKSVNDQHLLRDAKTAAKNAGKNTYTCLRYWHDPLQQYSTDWDAMVAKWRNIFPRFVDGTFFELAEQGSFDLVEEDNEYLANSQSQLEIDARVVNAEAAIKVWNDEYRGAHSALNDIKLVLCNTAVGNWIDKRFAQIAIANDGVIGYHPYTHWAKYPSGETMRAANDWADLSGLWDRMEQTWGIKPMWAFTEAGPFESALDGWRSPNCLNGSINMYVLAMREWLEDVQQTSAYQEGRLYGFATFTTGGSQEWKYFETSQPELDVLANLTVEMWKPGEVVIPPQPPQQECLGEPRVQYHRVYNVIPQNATPEQGEEIFRIARDKSLETVGWSYDDAGVGGLNNRTARLWGIPASGQLKFANWYAQNYPGVIVEFVDLPGSGTPTHEIQDIVDDLPKHATKVYPTRSLQDITTLTIHHTVSPPDRPIEQIAAYHVDHNGWPGIGYHYVIKDTGEIFQTNYLETKSYHAGSYNAPGDENLWSVGIALQGDFTLSPPPQAQLDAAKWLVELLKGPLLGLQLNSVLGHREMPGAQTQCPGNTYPAWLNYVKGE